MMQIIRSKKNGKGYGVIGDFSKMEEIEKMRDR
jgi:hypothetical protein